ncbi:MAG: hypothetical protein H8K03_15730 [Nitrospira sp.]
MIPQTKEVRNLAQIARKEPIAGLAATPPLQAVDTITHQWLDRRPCRHARVVQDMTLGRYLRL